MGNRRLWLGLAVTSVFLIALVLQVDADELATALSEANYGYVIPGIATYFGSLYFRAYRWRFLLLPFRSVRVMRLYAVVLVGYMANNLLPVRLGEVVRSYYLARREPVGASTALATIFIERVFDGLTLLSFLIVAALFFPLDELTENVSGNVRLAPEAVMVVLVVPFAAALGLMVGIALYPERSLRIAALFTRLLPGGLSMKVDLFMHRFLQGFQGLHRPGKLTLLFLQSLPIWLTEAVMYYIIALGFGLDEYFDSITTMLVAMLLVTAVSNLATSLPSSQGSVGPFEFFAVQTLLFLSTDIGTGVASAYALVLHAALLLPVIAAGLFHLAFSSISLSQLTQSGQTSEPSAEKIL